MELRIGRILIDQGVLTEEQVEIILKRQQEQNKPFGWLCEQLFNIPSEAVELAWAAQYARLTRTIDPSIEVFDEGARSLITRRQAWQFCILPIRFDGAELMMATTQAHLRRALRFASSVIPVPLYFVMAAPNALGEALCARYPLPGMTPECVGDQSLESLLTMPQGHWLSKAG